jgi:hypothetical protein
VSKEAVLKNKAVPSLRQRSQSCRRDSQGGMKGVTMKELSHRVACLERQVRMLCGVVLVTAVIALILAAKPAETDSVGSTVKAPFQVVGRDGKPLLQVDEGAPGRTQAYYRKIYLDKGAPRLRLFDKTGKDTVVLIAGEEGGQIAAQSRRSGGFAVLSSTLNGGDLNLADEAGADIAVIQGSQADHGCMIFSPDGIPTVWLNASNDFSSVRVIDPKGDWGRLKLSEANLEVGAKGALLSLIDQTGEHTFPVASVPPEKPNSR